MTAKQFPNSLVAPDGSYYVTLSDGAGALAPVSSSTTAYPAAAVPITASATGTTAATVATLAATAGKTTYLSRFTITAYATAALAAAATVSGTITGSLNYVQSVGAATSAQSLTQSFYPAIPASAAIVVTSAAAGTGGNTAVTAWGYQL